MRGDRERGDTPLRGAPPGAAVNLASVWPEILSAVPAEERLFAEQALMAPVVSAADEDLAEVIGSRMPAAFDFVIVDGVVVKQTVLTGRAALELLGAGDVLAPPLTAPRQSESRAVSRYLAHGQASLAAINNRFRQAARRWPGIADFLHDRLARQTHRASMHLAMLHLPRAEDRLTALFADLAERFGRVTGDGVVIDLPLTHDLIGGLVASRRPTVTLALKRLAAQGQVQRLPDNRWKLASEIIRG